MSHFRLETGEVYVDMDAVEIMSEKFGRVNNSIRDVTLIITENGPILAISGMRNAII